jgi:hypothetical protein
VSGGVWKFLDFYITKGKINKKFQSPRASTTGNRNRKRWRTESRNRKKEKKKTKTNDEKTRKKKMKINRIIIFAIFSFSFRLAFLVSPFFYFSFPAKSQTNKRGNGK